MGRNCIKAAENPCFRCRKEAAKYDERLYSREGASELLGVSVSSLAEYETGATKVIPVDKIVLMADLYKSPELKVWYCTSECPIGKTTSVIPSPEMSCIERTVLCLIKLLNVGNVDEVTKKLIDITADGIVSEDESVKFQEVMDYLDELIRTAGELKLIGAKINGRRN